MEMPKFILMLLSEIVGKRSRSLNFPTFRDNFNLCIYLKFSLLHAQKNYLNGSPPLSKSTIPSPPPVFGEVAFTGFLILTCPDAWAITAVCPLKALFDFASNNLTVSLTLDLGRGGITGFTGDLTDFNGGLTLLFALKFPPAEEALWGDLDALMDNLSSSRFGKEIGLGILDLLDLLVLEESAESGLLPPDPIVLVPVLLVKHEDP